jgi:hypothetical protein
MPWMRKGTMDEIGLVGTVCSYSDAGRKMKRDVLAPFESFVLIEHYV